MEIWKIEKTLETLSPEEQRTLIMGLIKKEKEIRNSHTLSIIVRSGLTTLTIGGIVATLCGYALIHDPSIAKVVEGIGIATSLVGIGGPIALNYYGADIMDNCIEDRIQANIEATNNINQLNLMLKSLNENSK